MQLGWVPTQKCATTRERLSVRGTPEARLAAASMIQLWSLAVGWVPSHSEGKAQAELRVPYPQSLQIPIILDSGRLFVAISGGTRDAAR